MSLKFKWVVDLDGSRRTHVSVKWSLSYDNVARLLIAAVLPDRDTLGDPPLSKAEIERVIRRELREHGTGRADYWQDQYADERDHEEYVHDVWLWAHRQVSRL